ncbi:hypothetical protein RI129_001221 [Pyrocoelia pectoralis]|uniref:Uncharacterized protein n=1 Tax=Pyrocoelia pectoralis TaxID=417401 RepID=A0AAN7ZSI7_9COLE
MAEEEFYLTLLSNSSMAYFPNNTTASFITQLPKRLRLTGDWVVGLSEIHYPCTFKTVTEMDNLVYYRINPVLSDAPPLETVLEKATTYFIRDPKQIQYKEGGWFVIRLATGNYESVEEIVDTLNKHELISKLIKVKYNKTTKRVSITFEAVFTISILGFSQRLALQLGFRPYQNIKSEQEAHHTASIWTGLPSQMFVYCDIVEPQIVGDVLTPLMRIVNIVIRNYYYYGNHNDVVFSPTHYIPVMTKEFENIEINIRTDTGALMPFELGTLSLKLHFKRRR